MLQKQLSRDWMWRSKVEPNLSKEVKDMVTKMLEPDTSARVTTEALINHKWVTTKRTAIEWVIDLERKNKTKNKSFIILWKHIFF